MEKEPLSTKSPKNRYLLRLFLLRCLRVSSHLQNFLQIVVLAVDVTDDSDRVVQEYQISFASYVNHEGLLRILFVASMICLRCCLWILPSWCRWVLRRLQLGTSDSVVPGLEMNSKLASRGLCGGGFTELTFLSFRGFFNGSILFLS